MRLPQWVHLSTYVQRSAMIGTTILSEAIGVVVVGKIGLKKINIETVLPVACKTTKNSLGMKGYWARPQNWWKPMPMADNPGKWFR